MKIILVLNGPNLNLLGKREPNLYGSLPLDEITRLLVEIGTSLGIEVSQYQSNHEGILIDKLQDAAGWADGVIFNPGGYSHTSVALRDTISAINLPVIEVHLSNIYARENFRHHSLVAPVCVGSIAGLGWRSYSAALTAMAGILEDNK